MSGDPADKDAEILNEQDAIEYLLGWRCGDSCFQERGNPVTPSLRGQSDVPGKVERATPLLNKLEQGEMFLPNAGVAWLMDLESEWLTWTGLEGEPADQIDAAAYVAVHTVAVGRELVIPGSRFSRWADHRE